MRFHTVHFLMRGSLCCAITLSASAAVAQPARQPAQAAGETASQASSSANARDERVQHLIRSTVQIRCFAEAGSTVAMGSGVVIANNRTVVTNHHVLEGCEAQEPGSRVQIQAHDGSVASATVIRSFASADVGVLQLAGSLPVDVATLRSDGTARVMEAVIAVGYPEVARFAGVSEQQGRTTIGVVSRAAAQDLARAEPRWVLEHGAPIYGGNSGGPLFDECGQVLGINTFVPVDRRTRAAVPTVAYAVGSRTIQKYASEVTGATVGFGAASCETTMVTDTRKMLVAENVKAAPTPELSAFYASAIKRVERWQQSFAGKSAARDSAIGEAIALVGDQAANAQQSGETLQRKIAEVEAQWAASEAAWERELRMQRIVLGVVALVGIVAAGIGTRSLIRSRQNSRQLVLVQSDVRAVDGRAAEANQRADAAYALAHNAMDAAEKAANQNADPQVREEIRKIWKALDKRESHSVLIMSASERTRVLNHDAPAIGGAEVSLAVRDDDGERTVKIRPGSTAYVGRDRAAIELVAKRYLVPHVTVPLRQRNAEQTISRCHCSIANRGDHLEVVDLSSNGTWIDETGQRLSYGEAAVVQPGATLVLAQSRSPFRVHLNSTAAATVMIS